MTVNRHRYVFSDLANSVVELGGFADIENGLHLQQVIHDSHADALVTQLQHLVVESGPVVLEASSVYLHTSRQMAVDGQAPYSFDHTEYAGDADPIPVISAGWGVNWRHFRGLQTEGFDLMMDSQRAKLRVYNEKLVDIVLNGASNIQVQSYASQGLRNHRNTKKIDLTVAAIDLTTATAAQLIAFFQGPFATLLRTNRIPELDILWVSDEVGVNLGKVYVENGVTVGTVQEYLLKFIKVKEIRSDYALVGNEAVGYVRNRDVVTPLVGMATSIQMLPRPMPEHNYNARVIGAMGLQVKADAQGLGGVVYLGELT